MGDILDLFLDFERKLLALFRDMIVRPKDVIDSIQAKDNRYLGAFKFYSFVFSIWFILLRLTNSWLQFYGEEWVLPQRLREYAQAQVDFSFFLAPFLGLVVFFLPIGLLSYLAFRRSGYSLVTQLSFATNIGAMFMIYYLPMVYLVTLIVEGDLSETWVTTLVPICLGLPIVYTTYVYIRVFEEKVWSKTLKGIAIVGISAAMCITVLSSVHVDDFVHKNIFYRNYARFEITHNLPEGSWRENYSTRAAPMILFQSNTARHSHAYVSGFRSGPESDFSLLIFSPADTIVAPLKNTHNMEMVYPRFIVNDLENFIFVAKVNMAFEGKPGVTWLFDRKGNLLAYNESVSNLDLVSLGADGGKGVILAGSDYSTKVPMLSVATIGESDLAWKSFNGLKNFAIDEIMYDSAGPFQVVVQNTVGNRLREIRWLTGHITSDSFQVDKHLELFRNDFSPTLNGDYTPIHNSRLLSVEPGKSIVTYQVMTDSSFALDVTSIDVTSGQQLWNKTYSVPADLAFFQNTLYHDEKLFVLGTATTIFPRSFIMGTESRNLFLMVIDATNGKLENIYFLPSDTNFVGLQYFLETESMAYIEDRKIYWTVDGVTSHIISIDAL